MANGVKNTLVSVVAGLAIGAAAIFSPQAALSKNPKISTTPAPAAVHEFNKEKNKLEKSKINIDSASISKSGPASYSIPGLSVEPATTAALVSRFEGAQVIIQGTDHIFDLDYDKNAQLLLQLHEPLKIGSIFLEHFAPQDQDSLTAFCTDGRMNSAVQWVAYTYAPRGPHAEYSTFLTLTLARNAGVELLAIQPDKTSKKYDFLRSKHTEAKYVEVSTPDIAARILEQLRLHPGQRIWVQIGAGHIPALQKQLADSGVQSASFDVWAPSVPTANIHAPGDPIVSAINRNRALCAKYLPRLQACLQDALVENPNHKLSSFVDFILYTPDKPYVEEDYMRFMPKYFEREIRGFESKLGREWMVRHGVMDSTGTLVSGFISP